MPTFISKSALIRLQILYGQAAKRFDFGKDRASRIAWAEQFLGRKVDSFKTLTAAEGKAAIDSLQSSLGMAQTTPGRRQRLSKVASQKIGTEGRRDQIHAETTMVDGTEPVFTKIRSLMTALAMTEKDLKRFLRSSYGPNNGRDTILTLGDANRVYWALKRQVDHKEKTARKSPPGAAA